MIALAGQGAASQPRQTASPPNVLVVMTDDQTVEQLRVMPRVQQIAAEGATFLNSFANYPLCCPSRATFNTGQYAHNHEVMDNGRSGRLRLDSTLPVWLQLSGYYTGHVGKYFNDYGKDDPAFVPPGYSEWYAALGPTRDNVYDYGMNENGAVVEYGDQPQDYKQDVITAKAADFLARRAPAPEPFYLYVGYTAPHGAGPEPSPQPPHDCRFFGPKPAPRHAHAFDSEPMPHPPSFNEADVADKPADVAALPAIGPQEEADITAHYRCALEELLSVDEGVGQLLDILRGSGELRNTLVVFTSDNGFFFGEHRITLSKKRHYEEASRVPLLMMGPGISAGTRVRELVVNADIAPTIVEATGATARLRLDGISLFPLIDAPRDFFGRELLIESNSYKAIRTERYIYVQHGAGGQELYDLERDPFELQSVHADPRYRRQRNLLAHELRRLRGCAAARCRRVPDSGLRLAFGPGDCRRQVAMVIVDRNGEAIDEVSFRLGRRLAGVDRNPPFKHRLDLGGPGRTVKALVDFLDGRRITLREEVGSCGG